MNERRENQAELVQMMRAAKEEMEIFREELQPLIKATPDLLALVDAFKTFGKVRASMIYMAGFITAFTLILGSVAYLFKFFMK